MKLNEYQDKAMLTCMDTCDNPTYMLLNLVGEVGEFASKVAKHVRKGEARIFRNHIMWVDNDNLTDEENEKQIVSNLEALKAECWRHLVAALWPLQYHGLDAGRGGTGQSGQAGLTQSSQRHRRGGR